MTTPNEPEVKWSKAFRITLHTGFTLDGVQFPSGRCVVDDPEWGLVHAATSLEDLEYVKANPDVVIEWEVP